MLSICSDWLFSYILERPIKPKEHWIHRKPTCLRWRWLLPTTLFVALQCDINYFDINHSQTTSLKDPNNLAYVVFLVAVSGPFDKPGLAFSSAGHHPWFCCFPRVVWRHCHGDIHISYLLCSEMKGRTIWNEPLLPEIAIISAYIHAGQSRTKIWEQFLVTGLSARVLVAHENSCNNFTTGVLGTW